MFKHMDQGVKMADGGCPSMERFSAENSFSAEDASVPLLLPSRNTTARSERP